jgi:alkanesulfonate monooxygenase SsuD/methylene tetrahydromethanopterin reductase-like flavin-dependent oxidoreductase (luciferase family)
VAMGRSMRERGRNMDETVEIMRTVFAGERLGDQAFPVAAHGHPKLLFGGTGDAAVRRTIRYGAGWIAGGATPDQVKPMIDRIRQEWHDAGREGEPRFAGLAYFGLSDEETSRRSLRTYYAFTGDFAEMIANGALRTPQAVRDTVKAFEEVGLDELILDPTVPDLGEVDRLADAVL